MEKSSKKYSKATMLAAALIITGTTAIFGTYASGLNDDLNRSGSSTCYEETNQANDKQKTKIQPNDEKTMRERILF